MTSKASLSWIIGKPSYCLLLILIIATLLPACTRVTEARTPTPILTPEVLIDRGDLGCMDQEEENSDTSGKHLAFLGVEKGKQPFYLLDIDTKAMVKISPDTILLRPSPNKKRILFQQGNRKWAVYDIESGQTTSLPEVIYDPDWTSNSKCLIGLYTRSIFGLYRLSDGVTSYISPPWLQEYANSSSFMMGKIVFAPDGKNLAFECNDGNLCIANIRGDSITRVPKLPEEPLTDPFWLDRDQLAYSRIRVDVLSAFPIGLGLFNIATKENAAWEPPSRLRNIVPGPNEYSVTTDMFHKQDPYSGDQNVSDIIVVDMQHWQISQMITSSFRVQSIAWSPTGQRLAIATSEVGEENTRSYLAFYDGSTFQPFHLNELDETKVFIGSLFWLN